MAKETIIKFTDDIDGTEASETVAFSFRGTPYEIDLGAKNVAAFEKSIAKYVAAARAAGTPAKAAAATTKARKAPGRPRKAAAKKATRAASKATKAAASTSTGSIREWAQANGFAVGSRGRIPAAAREAYEASLS